MHARALGEFRVLKAWVVCSCLPFVGIVATVTVALQHSSKFVAAIAVTAGLNYVQHWEGVVGGYNTLGVGGGRAVGTTTQVPTKPAAP